MSDRIDTFIEWLKWPVAVAALVFLTPAAMACLDLISICLLEPTPFWPFIGGAGLYLLMWLYMFRRWRATLLSTFEHEITHALFAILTLHRVTELRATWSRGGHVKILGRGNWLITVAPYFFPTVCFVIIPIFGVIPGLPLNIADALIGAAFMYHITSTMRETHSGQTDLKTAGYLFSTMFLPTANLLAHGMVLAFALGGWGGIGRFLGHTVIIARKWAFALGIAF